MTTATFKGCDIPFREVTVERYDEMLGVLPPVGWVAKGFLMGEPASHRTCKVTNTYQPTFLALVQCTERFAIKGTTVADAHIDTPAKKRYYESSQGLTMREWLALEPHTLTIGK